MLISVHIEVYSSENLELSELGIEQNIGKKYEFIPGFIDTDKIAAFHQCNLKPETQTQILVGQAWLTINEHYKSFHNRLEKCKTTFWVGES